MRRLITAALPYVNNTPHLGNLVQGLSGDVFARFSRLCGYETLYICGTDEYGTATETRARERGVSPRELCDHYYGIHDAVYKWFEFSFDIFGRTSHPLHSEITQGIFTAVYEHDYIVAHTTEQLYSEQSEMFLADRYVTGTCPKCQHPYARGDQCEQCGSLLDPSDLIDVRSAIDGSVPITRETRHLYINLPRLLPLLENWLADSKAEERWAHNAMQMTRGWMRDGLQERTITRDLTWGIPVPLDEYRKKVFYVWFDAPIGYISITAQLTDDWRDWWQNPAETRLYQFVGKDNIPFHTVVFPCSLLATGQNWTMVHHISSTEYLNYEGGQFSKSRGVGVFGTDAIESGIPADVWRFYLIYNRPESSDYTFTWDDFAERTNKELIGNFANFFNRLTSFIHRNYEGKLPTTSGVAAAPIAQYQTEMQEIIAAVTKKLEASDIRDALHSVLRLSDLGNRLFQQHEPWKAIKTDPAGIAHVLRFLLLVARNLSILIAPFLPQTARRCRALLGMPDTGEKLHWEEHQEQDIVINIDKPQVLFQRLDAKQVARFKQQFGGSADAVADRTAPVPPVPVIAARELFRTQIRLVAARITAVAAHGNADKLLVEQIDDGSGEARQIVSGLARYYQPEELIGKTVVIVDNLAPIKLRGEMSSGMLLAAAPDDESQLEVVEVDAAVGTQLHLHDGQEVQGGVDEYQTITIDQFFAVPIRVVDHQVCVDGLLLVCADTPVRTTTIANGSVS